MATVRTPEENGKLILAIYAHFHSQPGQVLLANNFIAVAARRRVPIADLQKGLDYAAARNWIEQTENGALRLTQRGFDEMPEPGQGY